MKFYPKSSKVTAPDLPLADIAEGAEKGKEYRNILAEGGRNAMLSGATMGLFDNAAAWLDSLDSEDYELELLRRKRKQRQFEELRPGTALTLELLGSLPTGGATFAGVRSALTAGSKVKKTADFMSGRSTALYKTKNGKLKEVKVEGTSPNGSVMVRDGSNSFAVNKKNLTARTSIKGDTPSNAAVGTVEGAAWGFSSAEGEDRAQSAVIGGLLGLSMGRVLDVFTSASPSANPIGRRSPADDAADAHMMGFTDDFIEQSRRINDESLRGGQLREEAQAKVLGPSQPVMQYLDPFERSRGADLYNEKEGFWRSVREGYDKWLTGTSDFLMRRISPQLGALAQRSDETAVRNIGKDVDQYVDPITNVLKLELDDNNFHGMLLDYGKGVTTRKEILDYVRRRLGDKDAEALKAHLKWSDRKHREHIIGVSGRTEWLGPEAKTYLHTLLTKEAKAKKFQDNKDIPDFDYPTDPGLERRTRGDFRRGEVNPTDYQPVLATNLRRIMNNERLVQLAQKFGMPRHASMTDPVQFFKAMERHFVSKGIDSDLAKRAVDAIRENLIGQTKSPNQWLQALNSFGYATTLAGPKSALLNLQDPMIASAKYGFGNVVKGLKQESFEVADRGIRQNVGEFLNTFNDAFSDQRSAGKRVADAMRVSTDWLMKGSGFAAADNIGKGWTIKAILNHAADLAKTPNGLEDAWGFYFTRAELAQIKKELNKWGSDFGNYSGRAEELLEELAFAGLGQQQLISAMGRPVGWARHPNARPMWALRGFAIKQQALLMREIVEKIRDGRTDEALAYFTRYVALAGGSFGLLNEARQWMFGDGEATITGVVQGMADQVVSAASINTIGLNDYQYGSLMENGLLYTMAEGMLPLAVDRPYEAVKGIYDSVVAPEGESLTPLIRQVPFVNQPLNLIQNLGEDDLIPDPMKKLERVIRPQEQR